MTSREGLKLCSIDMNIKIGVTLKSLFLYNNSFENLSDMMCDVKSNLVRKLALNN